MSAMATQKSKMSVHMIAKISVLGALACILMLFELPLPIAPPFYKIDFSEVVVLIGGFAMGPWAAVCIEGLKVILNLLMNGSATMGIGEIANFIIGCAFVVPAVIFYQRNKTKKNALIGLIVGTILMSIVGAFVNYFMVLPAYAFFMKPAITMDIIIGMGQVIHPGINGAVGLILLCVVPFNIIKGVLVSMIVFISYKKVAPLLKK